MGKILEALLISVLAKHMIRTDTLVFYLFNSMINISILNTGMFMGYFVIYWFTHGIWKIMDQTKFPWGFLWNNTQGCHSENRKGWCIKRSSQPMSFGNSKAWLRFTLKSLYLWITISGWLRSNSQPPMHCTPRICFRVFLSEISKVLVVISPIISSCCQIPNNVTILR